METILASVAIAAVIVFGALISLGNARQKQAIDGLREHITLWAVQDLKLKRERFAHGVQVPDPLSWLNNITSKVCGYDLQLQVLDVYETPQSLICSTGDGGVKFIFSPLSPTDLRRIKSGKPGRLSRFMGNNPILFLPKDVKVHELSVLKEGYLFDLELALTWKLLTNQSLELASGLWMYEYSPSN